MLSLRSQIFRVAGTLTFLPLFHDGKSRLGLTLLDDNSMIKSNKPEICSAKKFFTLKNRFIYILIVVLKKAHHN
ncbi:hypothetical protein D3841_09585 [Streptococcus mutans]|nr:hypothetical protein [Streptococcus mutans]NLQ96282.1 hypothetical protein [Streptococcus mutans]